MAAWTDVLWLLFIAPSLVLGSGSKAPNCEEVIRCECVDLNPVTGVICNNVTDFALLTEKLRDGSLYEVNETYEITLTGVEVLPPRFLEGLIVFRLYLDDPLTREISEGAFDGVIRLRVLHVRNSSIKVLPNFTKICHSLRNLNFDGSKLTAVNQELQNLSLLTELTLRKNLIRTVAADALLGTTNLIILDFSGNLLESLPPDLFDSLHQLNKLVLSHNHLSTVHGLLKALRPKIIYFDHNNLTNADDVLHDNMTTLETVQLNNNPLLRTSYHSFNGKIPNVRFLYLDHCEIEQFEISHFQELSILALLDLSENKIETIPNETIDVGENLQLLLDNNRITTFEAEIKYSMKRLYLSGNRLQYLGSMLQLTQLAEVEVNNNLLQALTDTDLRGLHETENLLLRNNSIRRLDAAAFKSVRNDLQNLDLSINLLKNLNGSVRYLSQLKSLNVSSNQIDALREGEFIGLNELSELYMQNNKIIALSGQMQRMPQLVYLILQNNRIPTLSVEQLPRSLQFLYFKENPIKCDCRIMTFLEWLDNPSSPKTDVSYCRRSETQDVQQLGFSSCKGPCDCYCNHDVNDSYIAVNCASQNLSSAPEIFVSNSDETQQQLLTVDPNSMIIHQNRNPEFSVVDKVLTINLQDNRICSLERWRFPFDLKELRLSGNQLTTLPCEVGSMRSLQRLTLSENPWSCTCEALGFKNWLTFKSESVLDINQTKCAENPTSPNSGRLIAALSDADLCPTSVGLYVSVVFSVLSILLLVLFATVMYNRYEMNIKVWLYAHGVSWVKEDDLDRDKTFDAFLSFSHEDEEFVTNHIIAGIEDRMPNIRLCIHYKHFVPGEFIHNNIMNAVKSSKRTVLILTEKFFESEWCLWEFRAAHIQAMEDKIVRIIVIKVGETPEDIDLDLKVYLKSTTYVTWGEKHFWRKLIYCLPEPSAKRFTNSISIDKVGQEQFSVR